MRCPKAGGATRRYGAAMLSVYLRMFPVLLRARLRAARAPTPVVSQVRQRVRLDQIDANVHMNQARYADAFELGRAHWMVRSGAWAAWRAQGINPVVANQRIEYRRELRPWQRYLIDTRPLGVEGRLLHLQGHMLVGDRVHARNDLRLIFVGPQGVLAPAEVEALCTPVLTEALTVEDWTVAA